MKIYVKEEDQLSDEFCESKNCVGEPPTESDNSGCTGCDACEEYVEENYNRIVSESDEKEFVCLDDFKKAIEELEKVFLSVPQPSSLIEKWKGVLKCHT